MCGVIERFEHRPPSITWNDGDAIVLLGRRSTSLAGSRFAAVQHGLRGGTLEEVDFAAHDALCGLVRELVTAELCGTPAGVVSGLSGFAFSAVAACVLWLLPPLQAVPLIMLLSACNQLLSVGTLRKEMVLRGTAEREGALAYIAGGLVGVPIGLGLLQALPTSTFAGGLGLFLIVYSALVLLKPDSMRVKLSGWKPAVAVGAAGGIIGGFSAFPGSMPVVYLGLRGVSKAETRGITQPYILALQLISLSVLALTHSAIFNAQFWLLWALTLPAVLLGSSAGVALYRRMSEVNFRRAVLILLIVSGVSLSRIMMRARSELPCPATITR